MENTPQTRSESRTPASRLVFGLFLLLIGGLLLAGNLGYDVPRQVWSYWPLLLVGLGLVKLIRPASGDERRSGLWLVIVGGIGWINVRHLFGLDWGSSWPLFVIAAGAMMLLEGIGWQRRRGARNVS